MLASSGACLESGSRAEIASCLVSFSFSLSFCFAFSVSLSLFASLSLPLFPCFPHPLPLSELYRGQDETRRDRTHINLIQRDQIPDSPKLNHWRFRSIFTCQFVILQRLTFGISIVFLVQLFQDLVISFSPLILNLVRIVGL